MWCSQHFAKVDSAEVVLLTADGDVHVGGFQSRVRIPVDNLFIMTLYLCDKTRGLTRNNH